MSLLPSRDEIVASLYSAVLSDVLDGLGLTRQAMRPFVRPLDEGLVLFGRARTGLYAPRYHVEPGRNPYEVDIALVGDLKPGEVAVLACRGPTNRIAPGASSAPAPGGVPERAALRPAHRWRRPRT